MTLFDRRRMLALSGATLLAGCGGGGGTDPAPTPQPPVPADPPEPPTTPDPPQPRALGLLKDAAGAKGMGFGAAIYGQTTFREARYRNLLLAQCDLAVAENDHKWTTIRPGPNDFYFAPGDELVDFARAAGLDFRFHTLLWADPVQDPAWVAPYDFGANPAAEAERLLREHVARVTDRYAGDMKGWDVVNEAVDSSNGAYRSSPFSRAMGGMEPVLDTMFAAAREALPKGRLVYNDFPTWNSFGGHRDGVLRLLEGMLSQGTPIDALGIQSHLWGGNADGFDADERAWRAFLDEVTGMGLGLVLTELDVNDQDLPGDVEARDARVADVTKAYLDLTLSYGATSDILTWGLVNRFSWLQQFKPRADGLANRPLPFDDDYAPTPMAFAIKDAIEAAPMQG